MWVFRWVLTGKNPGLDEPEIAQCASITKDHADNGDGGFGIRRISIRGIGPVPGTGAIGDKPTEGANNPDGDKADGVCEPGIPVWGLILAGDDALEAVKPGLLMSH